MTEALATAIGAARRNGNVGQLFQLANCCSWPPAVRCLPKPLALLGPVRMDKTHPKPPVTNVSSPEGPIKTSALLLRPITRSPQSRNFNVQQALQTMTRRHRVV